MLLSFWEPTNPDDMQYTLLQPLKMIEMSILSLFWLDLTLDATHKHHDKERKWTSKYVKN